MIKIASLSALKKEIEFMPHAELIEVCMRLIKYKKENKELLNYLLFESGDEKSYIESLKIEVVVMFTEVNIKSMHWAKKTIRKILRWINRYTKYSNEVITQIEMLIFFCAQMNTIKIDFKQSVAMVNLYNSQVKKVEKLLASLHEDLQFDYKEQIDQIKMKYSDA